MMMQKSSLDMHVPLVCVVLSALSEQPFSAGSHGRPAQGLQAVLTGYLKSHKVADSSAS